MSVGKQTSVAPSLGGTAGQPGVPCCSGRSSHSYRAVEGERRLILASKPMNGGRVATEPLTMSASSRKGCRKPVYVLLNNNYEFLVMKI